MLTLVSGQPGNGKSLYTVWFVEQMRQKEGRPVYQHGIAGLTLPWLELADPQNWAECPQGSIIVIDEAWKVFPVRKQGAAVPSYVEGLATHRHLGMDIFLVTQHRHQLDTFVRKLIGRHLHIVRKFGAEKAQVFQWEVETDEKSEKERERAIRTDWDYPKEVYSWYKSAEIHTVKKDFPWRKFWWLWTVLAVLLFLIPYAIYKVAHLGDVGRMKSQAPAAGSVVAVPPMDRFGRGSTVAKDVLHPGSAPRYEGVYKVVSAPRIAGCIDLQYQTQEDCRCHDQSGADVRVTVAECYAWIHAGHFEPARGYPDVKSENIAYLNSKDQSSGKNDDLSTAATGRPATSQQ